MAYIKEYWNDKEKRAKVAKEHTELMEEKYGQDICECVDLTRIYLHYDCKNIKTAYRNQNIIVDDVDTVSAIMKYKSKNMAVLNFASYKNPGGMFLNGSKAQEECLCHESFLYNVLKNFQIGFYDWNNSHKNRSLYLNRTLYSPNILFERGDEKVRCDVITCAAPNRSAAQKYCDVSDYENAMVLDERIEFVLDIAAYNDVDTLILGAWGCGVFGQNPYDVAYGFKEKLETTHHCFDTVVFAVPKGKDGNYEAFANIFSEK